MVPSIYYAGLTYSEEAEAHLARHRLTYDEVDEAIRNRIHDLRRSGEYLQVIAQMASGRFLTIILDEEEEGLWYPVTARVTTPKERRLIGRRSRKG